MSFRVFVRRCVAVGFAVAFGLGVVCAPGSARADGAFPDSQGLLTPETFATETILVTTFGVVYSQDAGKSWLWTCEQTANAFGQYYQLSLAPRHRIYALANRNVAYSDDQTCTWRSATGPIAMTEVSDFWVDRSVPDRLWAIGVHGCETGTCLYSLFKSTDGGVTFGNSIYDAASGNTITGVESASSAPDTIYLTMSVGTGATSHAALARSNDGGNTWTLKDLSGSLGTGSVRLISVDPVNAKKVFLLFNEVMGQSVALTEDAGDTASLAFPRTNPGDGRTIQGFVRTLRGTILLATELDAQEGLYRSTDGGKTFQPTPNAPHIRAFSVRGENIYAATNNFADDYALGLSTDDGVTWTPVLSYDHINAIPACMKAACNEICSTMASMGLWSQAVCTADAPQSTTDGGVMDAAGNVDATGGADRLPIKSGGKGCSVVSAERSAANQGAFLFVLVAGATLRGRGRGRVPKPRGAGTRGLMSP